jgi:hypothetical protein
MKKLKRNYVLEQIAIFQADGLFWVPTSSPFSRLGALMGFTNAGEPVCRVVSSMFLAGTKGTWATTYPGMVRKYQAYLTSLQAYLESLM